MQVNARSDLKVAVPGAIGVDGGGSQPHCRLAARGDVGHLVRGIATKYAQMVSGTK